MVHSVVNMEMEDCGGNLLNRWWVKIIMSLLKTIKKAWDPQNIFNPNKIVDTPSDEHHAAVFTRAKNPNIQNHFPVL